MFCVTRTRARAQTHTAHADREKRTRTTPTHRGLSRTTKRDREPPHKRRAQRPLAGEPLDARARARTRWSGRRARTTALERATGAHERQRAIMNDSAESALSASPSAPSGTDTGDAGTGPGGNAGPGVKRRPKAKRVCARCRMHKTVCDDARPCQRCVRLGFGDSCVDAEPRRGAAAAAAAAAAASVAATVATAATSRTVDHGARAGTAVSAVGRAAAPIPSTVAAGSAALGPYAVPRGAAARGSPLEVGGLGTPPGVAAVTPLWEDPALDVPEDTSDQWSAESFLVSTTGDDARCGSKRPASQSGGKTIGPLTHPPTHPPHRGGHGAPLLTRARMGRVLFLGGMADVNAARAMSCWALPR